MIFPVESFERIRFIVARFGKHCEACAFHRAVLIVPHGICVCGPAKSAVGCFRRKDFVFYRTEPPVPTPVLL